MDSSTAANLPPEPERAALTAGLALLLQAQEVARWSGSDVWDFAVEIDRLQAAGLTNTLLRWLVKESHVEHRREVTRQPARRRRFGPAAGLTLGARSCFVLTPEGGRLAASCRPGAGAAAGPPEGSPTGEPVPHWDEERRQLLYQGLVVKEYRGRAGNQERLLAVFEKEGWPPRVEDPLPLAEGIDAPTRLRDTVRRLNRRQRHALLRFRTDGRGGILWFSRGDE
jgi:hypothetical protein